jgi:hypothetical protein
LWLTCLIRAIDAPNPTARTYLVFGDLEGKFDVLRVECARCDRKGRYRRARAASFGHGHNEFRHGHNEYEF